MLRSFSLSFPLFGAVAALSIVGCGAGNGDKGNGGTEPLDSGTGGADTSVVDDTGGGSFDVPSQLDVPPDSNPFDPDAACAAKSFTGTKIPLAIAIVFDDSGSMADGSPSKMSVARSGLEKALSDPKFDDVAVGLFKFGYTDPGSFDGCTWDKGPSAAPVPLASGRTELFAVIDALSPSGSTPTYDGMNAAYVWLAPRVKAKTVPENGKTIVLVVTDGAPTCGTYTVDQYVSLVLDARTGDEIDTFFVGLPGTEDHFDSSDPTSPTAAAFMSKMAARGTDPKNLPAGCDADPDMSTVPAKPCYYDFHSSFSVDAFAAAIESIRKTVTSCDYVMPTGGAGYDPDHPGIFVTDSSGTRTMLPECTDPSTPPAGGCWEWTDTTHKEITIYGSACDTVKTDDGAKVDILLPCKVK